MPILGSLGSQWLLCLAVSQACSWCLSSALQKVSDCCALLCLKSAHYTCIWLFRRWVAAVHWCISSLLKMPVLGSLECEWLWCLCVLEACWWCLSLVLQYVSGCNTLLCVLSLLMISVLGSPESEWLQCLVCFRPFWQCLSLTLQIVSACYALLCFKAWLIMPILGSPDCECLFCVLNLLLMPVIGSLGCELLLCLAVFQACW